MVDITEIPLTGKMKEKFVEFFSEHKLESISLGDFGKWQGGGTCAVCGHGLSWAFRNNLEHRDIGICCATNILALQKCKGDYDKLNFDRIVKLEKKTIIKRQKEWEKKQEAIKLEIKYNDEFKFCTSVMNMALTDNFFKENRFVSLDDDSRNETCNGNFLYGGIGDERAKPLRKVYQCNSWLSWLQHGTVNEYYTNKLHDLMKETPEQIIQEAKQKVVDYQKLEEKHTQDTKFYQKLHHLKDIRLAKFDVDFVNNLQEYFQRYSKFSDKQKEAINKLWHKYKKQLTKTRYEVYMCFKDKKEKATERQFKTFTEAKYEAKELEERLGKIEGVSFEIKPVEVSL